MKARPEFGQNEDTDVTALDLKAAEEIARFIADRAFGFEDHESRAWALTDFEIWASLSGRDAELALVPRDRTDQSG